MEGLFRRRRLPHWDMLDGTYFVTAGLAGSIPARGLLDLARYREELDARRPRRGQSRQAWEREKHTLIFARVDQWLDDAPVVRYLEDYQLAREVQRSFYHFADERYYLLAYVVMPSHIHWLFRPTPGWCAQLADRNERRSPREVIMHSLKSFTANRCNQLLGRTGTFWQDESYDHWVRTDDELLRILEYIEQNPVRAGLAASPHAWPFSSAWDRVQRSIPRGEALPRGAGF